MDLSLTLLRVIEVPKKLVFLKIYLFLISFSKSGGSSDFPNLRPSLEGQLPCGKLPLAGASAGISSWG
jgi:hypothetical protein